jgi:hypothetical protein
LGDVQGYKSALEQVVGRVPLSTLDKEILEAPNNTYLKGQAGRLRLNITQLRCRVNNPATKPFTFRV